MTTVLIFSTASLIISGFSFLFLFRYLKRRTGQERILAEFRDEVEEIIHQIDEVTDRDLTLVEERTKTLRTLLEDTDRRIAVYAREVERRRSQEAAFADYDRDSPPARNASRFGSAYTRLGAPIAGKAPPEPVEPGRPEPAAPQNSEPFAAEQPGYDGPAALSGLPLQETAPPSAPFPPAAPTPPDTAAVPTVSASAAAPVPGAPPPPFSAELPPPQGQFPRIVRASRPIEPKPLPFAERVAELSRAGFSANLIAAQLGAAVVEVELAIALAGRSGGLKPDD